jgi:hypothetical protein
MTKTLALILSGALSASVAGCTGQAEVRYSGNASAPELVTMESDPSVSVVANSEEPVFYSENTYWLYRDQHWYRSASHRGGWTEARTVPEHVRRIDRPTTYVHFRAKTAPRTTYNQRIPVPNHSPERPVYREDDQERSDDGQPVRTEIRTLPREDSAADRAVDHTNDPSAFSQDRDRH